MSSCALAINFRSIGTHARPVNGSVVAATISTATVPITEAATLNGRGGWRSGSAVFVLEMKRGSESLQLELEWLGMHLLLELVRRAPVVDAQSAQRRRIASPTI
jgi:hypothetical protein